MRHVRLGFKLVTGFLWALAVAATAGYIVLNEEYRDSFDAWGRK